MNKLYFGDSLEALREMDNEHVDYKSNLDVDFDNK